MVALRSSTSGARRFAHGAAWAEHKDFLNFFVFSFAEVGAPAERLLIRFRLALSAQINTRTHCDPRPRARKSSDTDSSASAAS